MPKCKHRKLLVVRTFDLKHERAVCLDCDSDVRGWRLGPFMSTAYIYRYISTEDFLKGAMPTLTREVEKTPNTVEVQ